MIILAKARNDSAEVEGVGELECSGRSGIKRHIRGCRGSEFDGGDPAHHRVTPGYMEPDVGTPRNSVAAIDLITAGNLAPDASVLRTARLSAVDPLRPGREGCTPRQVARQPGDYIIGLLSAAR
jgi:hypothetical protein